VYTPVGLLSGGLEVQGGVEDAGEGAGDAGEEVESAGE